MADVEKKRHLFVSYIYAAGPGTTASFAEQRFPIALEDGGWFTPGSFGAPDRLCLCERGIEVTIPPGWLWRETSVQMSVPLAFVKGPEEPSTVVPFPTPPAAAPPASTPPGTAPPPTP